MKPILKSLVVAAAFVLIASAACKPKEWAVMGETTPPGAPVRKRPPLKKPNRPPRIISVTPSSGAGERGAFDVVVSDPDGAGSLAFVQTLLDRTVSTPGGCCVQVHPANGLAYLINDKAMALVGPAQLGTFSFLETPQCVLDVRRSSMNIEGPTLTLHLVLAFRPEFKGGQKVFVRAQDVKGAMTPFDEKGVWTVP